MSRREELKLTKYLPSILAVVVLIAGALADPVQAFIVDHPMLALVLVQVQAVISHVLPSPAAKKPALPDL
jgi:hypothetical protein